MIICILVCIHQLGMTPLHVAVNAGHQHIVRDLVSIPEIEIHITARSGLSSVTQAEKNEPQQPEIAAMLRAAAEERPAPTVS
jgi:ankyrin repeat protein